MRSVLVTGATGLLGTEIVRSLADAGHVVICVGRTRREVVGAADFIELDLESADFEKRLPQRADALIHLAQSEDFTQFPTGAKSIFDVNVASFNALLRWARSAGVHHVVHASTGGLYGTGPNAFEEVDPVRIEGPLAYYYSTKQAAEILAGAYSPFFTVAALRYFFIYGPQQKPNMLLPRLVRRIMDGQSLTLAGACGMRLNPIHVEDAARATIAALSLSESTIINVAGPEVLSIKDIGDTIASGLGKAVNYAGTHQPEGQDLIADISRMSDRLTAPRIRFRDGMMGLLSSMPT